jgi:hypothetical protein
MRKAIFLSIVALLVAVTIYVYWYYYRSRSEGVRVGELQKFSRKGNLFKTYEGEMVQLGFGTRGGNLNAQYFFFSVADDQLADSMEKCMGKVVRVHYVQYPRNLPWRGENYDTKNGEPGQYVVDRIEDVQGVQQQRY